MDPLIIIPTFIGGRTRRRDAPPTEVYDHPYPLTGVDRLGRSLKSLASVRGVGDVAILVVADPTIKVAARKKIHQLAGQFPQLSIMVVGADEALMVNSYIAQLQIGRLTTEIGLAGYSATRNLGLVIAQVMGYDSVVFLDDDEVVDDADFMEKAVYGLGKLTKRGIPILVKTGFYLNSDGNYHSKSGGAWYDRYWRQGEAFNAWIDTAMAGPRLSRSNHVCGGCLAIHREAFRRLAFDPWIVRGEDLDYLLNLRMYGADVWFDNQWKLRHLPPADRSEGERFRQDIFRWLYEYRKMEYSRSQIDLHPVKPSSLTPYPGPFLEPGIDKRIKRTAWLRSVGRPDKAAYRAAARAATAEAQIYAQRNCSKYFEFQLLWPELMHRLQDAPQLAEALSDLMSFEQAEEDARVQLDPGATGEIQLNLAE